MAIINLSLIGIVMLFVVWEALQRLFGRTAVTALALNQLATIYDGKHLDQPAEMEQVLRELISVTPDDLTPCTASPQRRKTGD